MISSDGHIYVTSFGAVYKIDRDRFIQMMKDVIDGREVNFVDYGVQITGNLVNLTDCDDEVARNYLNEISSELGQPLQFSILDTFELNTKHWLIDKIEGEFEGIPSYFDQRQALALIRRRGYMYTIDEMDSLVRYLVSSSDIERAKAGHAQSVKIVERHQRVVNELKRLRESYLES